MPPVNASFLPTRERLARLETQMDQLLITAARAHADLRENIDWQRRVYELHADRIATLEKSAEATRTHLKWMKGVWLAMQGVILGWLGLK